MENINVQKRDLTVKAKKMRRQGMVPGSVFGKSLPDSISIQMEESVARKLVRLKREGSKLVLNIEGETVPVQIKEKTLNTVNNEILHLGFQALTADEKVNSVIHLILANDDKVEGPLEQMQFEIPYASLPGDMIDTVTVDLEGMPAGTILTIKDIPELNSDKIDLQVDPESIVLRINNRKLQTSMPVAK